MLGTPQDECTYDMTEQIQGPISGCLSYCLGKSVVIQNSETKSCSCVAVLEEAECTKVYNDLYVVMGEWGVPLTITSVACP